jgi:hypothetical protein
MKQHTNQQRNDMQPRTENTAEQNDQIIHQFIQGLVDSRKKECKHLKETHLSCRNMIEARISETPDVNRVLFKYQGDPWVKKILISHIFLQMCYHATSWDVEDSQPIP